MRHDYGFEVRGIVDGAPAFARWTRGGGLVADEELRRRVDVVVALGETWPSMDDDKTPVVATLDHGITSALLTVIRAFSVVEAVDIQLQCNGQSIVPIED